MQWRTCARALHRVYKHKVANDYHFADRAASSSCWKLANGSAPGINDMPFTFLGLEESIRPMMKPGTALIPNFCASAILPCSKHL